MGLLLLNPSQTLSDLSRLAEARKEQERRKGARLELNLFGN